MFDLMTLAFEADLTRVFSFKMSRDVSGRVFPESGVLEGFHNASHHRESGEDGPRALEDQPLPRGPRPLSSSRSSKRQPGRRRQPPRENARDPLWLPHRRPEHPQSQAAPALLRGARKRPHPRRPAPQGRGRDSDGERDADSAPPSRSRRHRDFRRQHRRIRFDRELTRCRRSTSWSARAPSAVALLAAVPVGLRSSPVADAARSARAGDRSHSSEGRGRRERRAGRRDDGAPLGGSLETTSRPPRCFSTPEPTSEAATRLGALTPLILACREWTRGHGGNASRRGRGPEPGNGQRGDALMLAAASGSVGGPRAPRDGSGVDAKRIAPGETALMFASAANRAEVVDLLPRAGPTSRSPRLSSTRPLSRKRATRLQEAPRKPARRARRRQGGRAQGMRAGGAGSRRAEVTSSESSSAG